MMWPFSKKKEVPKDTTVSVVKIGHNAYRLYELRVPSWHRTVLKSQLVATVNNLTIAMEWKDKGKDREVHVVEAYGATDGELYLPAVARKVEVTYTREALGRIVEALGSADYGE